MTDIIVAILRGLFVIGTVWALTAAIRHGRRELPGIEPLVVLVTASLILWFFVARVTPWLFYGSLRDWYDFRREIPPCSIASAVCDRVQAVCSAAALLLVVPAVLLPPLRARR
jgi:hypothetical protein